MPKIKPETVNQVLDAIERASTHPRELARQAIEHHREKSAAYDFETAPRELKRVMYSGTVRFKRRSWWVRLLFWR